MNDLKTAERSLMGQQNLKNLMLWHIMGYKTDAEGKKVKMPCCDVPVMAILKEFRSMAFENGGTLGRKAHRGDGTFPILFGYISYRIRIVLYLNVS